MAEENKEEKASKKTWKQNRQEKVKFTYKEQREYETIDEDIAKLEEKLASIERQITANATNSVKLRELMEKQENCATELEEKEERWMYLNELAEQMVQNNVVGATDDEVYGLAVRYYLEDVKLMRKLVIMSGLCVTK